ncbi:MAG: glycosyl hydrolase family 28-related protein, partial [Roseiarcus sp.]
MRNALILLTIALLSLPARAAPVVYWASDPVKADDTVALSGSDLTNIRSVEITRLADDDSRPAERPIDVPVLRASSSALDFVLPSALAGGVYEWRLGDDGAAVQGLLNAPTIYWVQGDLGPAASAGGWVRLMGRNIARAPQAQLEFTRPGAPSHRVTARDGGLWDATFAIPVDLAPGKWTLILSNGQGGARARRDAGSVEIRARPSTPSTVINVRDFGAKGDDKADDGEAVEKALDAAQHVSGGAVVLFPRGSYRLTRPETIPDGVVVSGENRGDTFLEWADTATPPPVLLDGFSNFTVQDLTIVSGRHFNVIHGGFPRPGSSQDGENITLRNLRIRALGFEGHLTPDDEAARQRNALAFQRNGVDSIGLAGRNLVVENCDVLGSGRSLYLLRPQGARIQGNTFANGRQGWYSLSGADGVIFTGNEVFGADLESTGGGINSMFAHVGYSMHVLIKNNRFHRFFGWDREAL